MIYIENSCPYKFDMIKKHIFKYPPTKNRFGKTKCDNDIKTILTINTNLVKVPTLITSDLHSHTESVLNDLQESGVDIMKYKPKIHMYGHCHHQYVIMYVNGVVFINADARIILLEPL